MKNRLSIFISYSSKEEKTMLKINDFIESLGHLTYFAPRDIPIGMAYPNAIIELINKAEIFLLIFSDSSQNSIWVQKELERAISKNKYVIPLRIQNVELNGYMEFLISNTQWIDVHDQMFEASAEKFGKYLDSISEKFGKKSIEDKELSKVKPVVSVRQSGKSESEVWYQQAKSHIDNKQYSEAFILLLQAANQDHSDAQNELGHLYEKGFGVNQNYLKAFDWYSKAAEQQNAEAIKNVGAM